MMNDQEINNYKMDNQEVSQQEMNNNATQYLQSDKPAPKKKWPIVLLVVVVCCGILSTIGTMEEKRLRQEAQKEQEEKLEKIFEEQEKLEDEIESLEPSDSLESSESLGISEASIQAERGVIENGVYRNEVFKLAFPVAEGMTVLSDQEIAQLAGDVNMELEEKGISVEQWEQSTNGVIYDAMIKEESSGFNILVMIDNTDISRNGVDVSVETELKMAKLLLTKEGYEVCEPYTRLIGEQEYLCIDSKKDDLLQVGCLRKQGKYFVYIYLTGAEDMEQKIEDYLNSFIFVE